MKIIGKVPLWKQDQNISSPIPTFLVFYRFLSSSSNLKRENQFLLVFVRGDLGVYLIDLLTVICITGLKLDFTSHGIMKSLRS